MYYLSVMAWKMLWRWTCQYEFNPKCNSPCYPVKYLYNRLWQPWVSISFAHPHHCSFSSFFFAMDVQRVFDSDEKQTCVRNTALWLLSLCLFSLKAIRQWYDCSFILVRGKTQWKVQHNCKTNRSWMHWRTVRTAEKVWQSAVCLHTDSNRLLWFALRGPELTQMIRAPRSRTDSNDSRSAVPNWLKWFALRGPS